MVCTWYVHDMHMVHGWWYGMACDSQCVEAIVPGWPWQILTDLDRWLQWNSIVLAMAILLAGRFIPGRGAPRPVPSVFFFEVYSWSEIGWMRLNQVDTYWIILIEFARWGALNPSREVASVAWLPCTWQVAAFAHGCSLRAGRILQLQELQELKLS